MHTITLDFETYYDKDCSLKKLTTLDYITHPKFKIHMLGLKVDDEPTRVFEPDQIPTILKRYFYEGNKNTLVAHNTMFDGLIIQKLFGLTAHRYVDTMAMFKGLAPYMRTNLGSMAAALFPNDKTKRKGNELVDSFGIHDLNSVEGLYTKIAVYCKNDVNLTYDCYQQMLQYFPAEELNIIHHTLAMWVEPKLLLDQPRVTRHLASVKEHTKSLIEKAGVQKGVLSSNPQFAGWIEQNGMQVPMKINAKGKPTYAFAKDDLEFTALRNEYPEHEPVWRARIASKSTIEESRAERLLNNAHKDDGWLRVPLKYYGAHTGRYAGQEKINLQNLGRGSELRRSLIAPKNEFIFVSDLSQIEARMNAWLSGETDLIADFRKNVDIYSKFAGENIYHRPVDRKRVEIDANGNEYNPDYLEGFVGKVAILGLGYGMSSAKFRETLAKGSMGPAVFISQEQADNIVYRGYRREYRNIVRNWATGDRVIRFMAGQGSQIEHWGPMKVMFGRIQLPNGMFLNYPQLKGERHHDDSTSYEYWTGQYMTNIYGGKIVENVVQALARIVVMQQALKIIDKMPHLKLALQVHDELIFTGPQENAKQTMADIIGYMSEAPDWCRDLPVAAEGGYALDYSK